MPDDFQNIKSGQGELKNNYEGESQYEAIKRRRKKAMEKQGLSDDTIYDWNETLDPSPEY